MKFIKIISLMLAVMFFAGSSIYAMPSGGSDPTGVPSSMAAEITAIKEHLLRVERQQEEMLRYMKYLDRKCEQELQVLLEILHRK